MDNTSMLATKQQQEEQHVLGQLKGTSTKNPKNTEIKSFTNILKLFFFKYCSIYQDKNNIFGFQSPRK
jgi:hypothetical protein